MRDEHELEDCWDRRAHRVAGLLRFDHHRPPLTTDKGDAGTPGPAADGGAVARGFALIDENGCRSCHGADLAGTPGGIPRFPKIHGANLTPDMDTGIGGWSDAQIATAIRTGIDDEGGALCEKMPHFAKLTDADVGAIVAYLRSVPAVGKKIPESECGGGTSDAGTD